MPACASTNAAGVCMSQGPCLTCANNRAVLATSSIRVTVTRELVQSQIVTVRGDADDDEIVEIANRVGRWTQDGEATYDVESWTHPVRPSEKDNAP